MRAKSGIATSPLGVRKQVERLGLQRTGSATSGLLPPLSPFQWRPKAVFVSLVGCSKLFDVGEKARRAPDAQSVRVMLARSNTDTVADSPAATGWSKLALTVKACFLTMLQNGRQVGHLDALDDFRKQHRIFSFHVLIGGPPVVTNRFLDAPHEIAADTIRLQR